MLDQIAWRETRQAKDHAIAPRQQLTAWAAGVREELAAALAAAGLHAERVAVSGHPDQRGHTGRDRVQVVRAAIAAVQERYPTWEVGNLVAALADELRRTPSVDAAAEDLAAAVLADPARHGVRRLSVRDVGVVPAALRRADGTSWFRPKNAGRYATDAQLATEARIVARARRADAVAVPATAQGRIREELVAAGLSAGQQDAVLAIVSSGRRGDVLIGPAGAGKSRTVGMLAEVWRTHTGGRVLGLATSQIATAVLAEDGLVAMNTTVFRHRFLPGATGHVRDRLRPTDLVVVDEAGMSGTAELDAISRLVAAAGAKMIYTGDPEQLRAVDAGGMLELLARDAGAVELTEIHRFTHGWERAASVRLRAGDPDALADYERHGRIRGGTEAEMTAAAVRGYLADLLAGRRPLLVVRDNAAAAEVSGRIRAELVAADRVSGEVLAETRDRNFIGVGDLVQARRNARRIRVGETGRVTNRAVYAVVGRDRRSGALVVRDGTGRVAHLPAGYVRRHLTLAYAVTDYAAEGLTVDASHQLVDRGTDRSSLYTSGTRGRDTNTFYVVCAHVPDHHDPQRRDSTPLEVLAAALTRSGDVAAAAELQRRVGDEETRSLAWVGTQWDLLTARRSREHATDVLVGLLGPAAVARLVDEPGYGQLMSAVRGLELAGHDPARVLAAAVARGSLHDATSLADVLRYRVRMLGDSGRTPERMVRDGDWTSYATPWRGPVGDYVGVLAAAATARQDELGERVAADPPAWALTAPGLGPLPGTARERAEWVRRAGVVAAYRDLHAVPDTQDSIGPAPSPERAFHHALWRHAHAALGHPADTLDYTTASDAGLREMRDAWRRAQTWAPPYVADDLREARHDAEDYRRDAVIWRAGLDRHEIGTAERDLDERDVAAAEQLLAVTTARVGALEQIDRLRADWYERSSDVRERAGFAGDELERRVLDCDTAEPVGEQQELFEVEDLRVRPAARTAHDGVEDAASVPAGYAALFARDELAADRADGQPALFEAQATPADLAAAQPLHLTTDSPARDARADGDRTAATTGGPAVSGVLDGGEDTVRAAVQLAQTLAEMKSHLDAAIAAAAARAATRVPVQDVDNGAAASSSYDHDQHRDAGQAQDTGLSL